MQAALCNTLKSDVRLKGVAALKTLHANFEPTTTGMLVPEHLSTKSGGASASHQETRFQTGRELSELLSQPDLQRVERTQGLLCYASLRSDSVQNFGFNRYSTERLGCARSGCCPALSRVPQDKCPCRWSHLFVIDRFKLTSPGVGPLYRSEFICQIGCTRTSYFSDCARSQSVLLKAWDMCPFTHY